MAILKEIHSQHFDTGTSSLFSGIIPIFCLQGKYEFLLYSHPHFDLITLLCLIEHMVYNIWQIAKTPSVSKKWQNSPGPVEFIG